jgi:predicted transcriptional regulator
MTRRPKPDTLSRRERQMMDIIYAAGQASAQEVRKGLPDPPSYSAVRATLRILVEKGHLKTKQEGQRNTYRPTRSPEAAARTAVQRLVDTFFGGSRERAVAALLEEERGGLDNSTLDQLEDMIRRAREQGR